MNMHAIGNNAYHSLKGKLISCYRTIANQSMKRAAASYCDDMVGEPVRKCVKMDGTWQKKGHNSFLNRFVSAIVEDKCVDTEVYSKLCFGCKMWEKFQGTPKYDVWKSTHLCSVNHTKSYGAIESAGAVDIFKRSVRQYNIIYEGIWVMGIQVLSKKSPSQSPMQPTM